VLDTNVRRTWQIDAERVRIDGKHWPQYPVARESVGWDASRPPIATGESINV
jgi:hypothetical protein